MRYAGLIFVSSIGLFTSLDAVTFKASTILLQYAHSSQKISMRLPGISLADSSNFYNNYRQSIPDIARNTILASTTNVNNADWNSILAADASQSKTNTDIMTLYHFDFSGFRISSGFESNFGKFAKSASDPSGFGGVAGFRTDTGYRTDSYEAKRILMQLNPLNLDILLHPFMPINAGSTGIIGIFYSLNINYLRDSAHYALTGYSSKTYYSASDSALNTSTQSSASFRNEIERLKFEHALGVFYSVFYNSEIEIARFEVGLSVNTYKYATLTNVTPLSDTALQFYGRLILLHQVTWPKIKEL